MAYVHVAVMPLKKTRLAEYQKTARAAKKLFMKYGALSYVEAVEADVKTGKVTSFPQSVQLKSDEIMAVAIATFKTKAAHDGAWKKMMKEPLFANMDMKNSPVDMMRLYFGSFKTIT